MMDDSDKQDFMREVMMPVPAPDVLMQAIMNSMRSITNQLDSLSSKVEDIRKDVAILKEERQQRIGAKAFVEWLVNYAQKLAIPVAALIAWLLVERNK